MAKRKSKGDSHFKEPRVKTQKKTGRSCCGYSLKNPNRAGHDQGHRKLTAVV